MISPLTWGLGAACLAAAAFAGVQTVRLADARTDLATERTERANERAAAAEVAAATQETYRLRERAQAKQLQEAQDVARLDTARADRAGADARADADRMRDELAAYAAAGRGGAAADTIEACRARASELAAAVVDGMRVQGEMARAFAALAVDYGLLYRGWPGAETPAH